MTADLDLNRSWFTSKSRTVARRGELHAPKWAHLGPSGSNDDASEREVPPPYKYTLSPLIFFILHPTQVFSLSFSLLLSSFSVLDFENVVGR